MKGKGCDPTGSNPPINQGLLTVQKVAENRQVSQRMIRP